MKIGQSFRQSASLWVSGALAVIALMLVSFFSLSGYPGELHTSKLAPTAPRGAFNKLGIIET